MPNMGGPLVTGSGLVFIAAALDDYLRAFDVETGEELWKGRLPAGGQATPMTYRLRPGWEAVHRDRGRRTRRARERPGRFRHRVRTEGTGVMNAHTKERQG